MERPYSNDWSIPTVKSFFLIAAWNLQSLLLRPLLHNHFTVCFWGKSLFPQSCYPPITQLKTAINPSPTHSPEHPFFKLNKPILQPFLVGRVQPSEHLGAALLGLLQCVIVSLVLESLKTRDSTQSVVSQVLNWEELINEAWWVLFRRGHAPERCLDEYRKWKDCIWSFSNSETCEWDAPYKKVFIKLLLYYCLLVNLVVSSELLTSCLPDEHKGRKVIQQEMENSATGDCGHVPWLSKRLRKRVCERWFSHPRVAFGLLVSWINLAVALLKHWLRNVWAASSSGITAQPLVGLLVLLHGPTEFPPKHLDLSC